MKKLCLLYLFMPGLVVQMQAQSLNARLKNAIATLESDPQLKHGIVGFYVLDAKTGKNIFEKNGQVGLAPASTQKIFTSAAAFEILTNAFRFQTYIGYSKEIANGKLTGNLFIEGNGDPTLGSWRWNSTTEEAVLTRIASLLEKKSITEILGDIVIDDLSYSLQPVPDGWIWQDIGNYYGAGCWGFNWRENQYDLILQSDNLVGSETKIVNTIPRLTGLQIDNRIRPGKKGSGDNGYIYASPYSDFGFTTGTIPAGEKAFTISGSMPQPALWFSSALQQKLKEKNIAVSGRYRLYSKERIEMPAPEMRILDSISSPDLDSMNFWFMRKSINLYGEAFLKAIASRANAGNASTDKGVEFIKDFWAGKGIEKSAINIIDGSGLSPQNRVTTHSLVKVLQYAKTRPWYASFYNSLPTFNGMKIKSGSIGGGRSFAGYHITSGGSEYIFAIIVNNYDGSSSEIVQKIYKVLDILK